MSAKSRAPHSRRWPAWVPFLIAAVVIAVLFAVGFLVGTALGLLPGQVASPPIPPAPGPQSQGPGGSGYDPATTQLTTERTTLELVSTYTQCGCTTRETRLSGVELAGLTQAQLAEEFAGSRIQSFSETHVVMTKTISGVCPDMTTYRTLGIRDSHVAVFAGRPGTGLLLQQVTNISILELTAVDRERLAAGIVLIGDDAVNRFLEGLPQ